MEIPDKRDLSRTGTVVTNWAGTDTGASALDSKAGMPPVSTLIELTLGFSALKARSRKHPGLAKRQNRFHTTKDRRERHEHLLRVSSDKRATRLRHKATYTYATVSPHQKRVLVLFPPLSHPHHRAATVGAPYNRPCAISVAQTTREDGADQRGDRGGRRPPPPPRLHELLRAWRPMQASHPPRRRGTRRRRPPRRRAPTGPPSAARPRVRGGGGALLPHRPRAHARRLGAGGGAGCSRPGCPCLIGRRGGRRVSAAAATWGGGGADAAAAAITGAAATGRRRHARTRAASTGDPRRRGRRPPEAGGRGRRAPTPAGRHAVGGGGGGQSQRRRRRRRPDGAPPRAAVAAPAGQPAPRRSRATADAAAAGQ